MSAWFQRLEARERMVVVGGATISVLILAWSFAWTPLRDATRNLDSVLADRHAMLADVRRLEAMGVPLPPPEVSTESLVLVVDRTHRAHGLGGTLSRNQPDGEDVIRVTFQRASFAHLVSWLGALRQGQGLRVSSATVDGIQESGLVDASLELRRQ